MFDPTMTEFSNFSESNAERHILSHRVNDSEHVRPKGIKICHLNIDRLMDHLDRLRIFTETHRPHVLGLNETKLDDNTRDEDLFVTGFHPIFRKDRNKYGGGIAIYVSEDIKFKKRDDLLTNVESISIELAIPYVKPIIVTSIYRSPGSPVGVFDDIKCLFSKIDEENREWVIAGDLNCDLLKPRDNDTVHIKRIYDIYNLKQIITEPTRTTSDTATLIDHIGTNKSEHILDHGVIPCGISDHDVIFAIRSMKVPTRKSSPQTISTGKLNVFDEIAFISELKMIPFDQIKLLTDDPNEMWFLWKTMFLDVLNKHAPVTEIKIKGNSLPYITSDIRKLIRQRDYLKKKANNLWQAYQHLRNKVKPSIRTARANYYSSRFE